MGSLLFQFSSSCFLLSQKQGGDLFRSWIFHEKSKDIEAIWPLSASGDSPTASLSGLRSTCFKRLTSKLEAFKRSREDSRDQRVGFFWGLPINNTALNKFLFKVNSLPWPTIPTAARRNPWGPPRAPESGRESKWSGLYWKQSHQTHLHILCHPRSVEGLHWRRRHSRRSPYHCRTPWRSGCKRSR